jgi:UDP-glucuronate 4-epimerase
MAFEFKKVLITGAAGFIGFHLARRLLENGHLVTGIDNMNTYYDVNLKKDRLKILRAYKDFSFFESDLADLHDLKPVFDSHAFDVAVNLAAQAGVRYSLENPHAYVEANLVGFVNLLECCRHHRTPHLVFASSSSVYGANTHMPFSVHHNVDHPVSLYAASKKANELLAHTYSHLYGLPCTGLRFFTVYGPWGRPDMALFLFTKAILEDKPIQVFNHGKMKRDFTYIDDIVEGVVRVMGKLPEPNRDWNGDRPDPGTSAAPYRIYNIGNNRPVELKAFIKAIETAIGKSARKEMREMQPGDVPATFADIDDLARDVGFRPDTPIETGIRRFVEWYRAYYGIE